MSIEQRAERDVLATNLNSIADYCEVVLTGIRITDDNGTQEIDVPETIRRAAAALASQPQAQAQVRHPDGDALAASLAKRVYHAAHVAPCAGQAQAEWAIADLLRPHVAGQQAQAAAAPPPPPPPEVPNA